jgi:ubiquinone/menaquinone biosynthesis C-methylase UbiE
MVEIRTNWSVRANGEYENLGWVKSTVLLDKMVELAQLRGNETIIDVGTGSLAVFDAFAQRLDENSRVFGFDISKDMIGRGKDIRRSSGSVFIANTLRIPLPSEIADIVTARMVYHHIPKAELPQVIEESKRLLKPGGRMIVSEYVAVDPEVYEFERRVFDIKEPERNLWTGSQLADLISSNWQDSSLHDPSVQLSMAVLGQYSVKDWMSKSGLVLEKQALILNLYLQASHDIKSKMGITVTQEGDALVDRPFAYVVAHI